MRVRGRGMRLSLEDSRTLSYEVRFLAHFEPCKNSTDTAVIGGENIYPTEIEIRLTSHPSGSITRAAVVGIPNPRLGEVVGAFLQLAPHSSKPTDEEIQNWTREVLGRHKVPAHIFWFGEEGIENEVPQTGSGKVKKHLLRDWGVRVVRERETRAKRRVDREDDRPRM